MKIFEKIRFLIFGYIIRDYKTEGNMITGPVCTTPCPFYPDRVIGSNYCRVFCKNFKGLTADKSIKCGHTF